MKPQTNTQLLAARIAALESRFPDASWHAAAPSEFFARVSGVRVCVEREGRYWVVSRIGRDASQTMHHCKCPGDAVAAAGVLA